MSDGPDQRAPVRGCDGCAAEPPEPGLDNRPGLSALKYRIGTWGSFLARMLAQLPRQQVQDGTQTLTPLAGINARAADDPSVAIVDAWALAADVLTFYQERIANEGFLRTAVERGSVLELARAIGYELSPGVAAASYLAFTADDTPAAPLSPGTAPTAPPPPRTALIPSGSQVQSVPGPGQQAQTFETLEDLVARADLNELRPRLTQPQLLDVADMSVPEALRARALRAAQPKAGGGGGVAIGGGGGGLGGGGLGGGGGPGGGGGKGHAPAGKMLELVGADGDSVLANWIYLTGTSTQLQAGDLVLAVMGTKMLPVRILSVRVDDLAQQTGIQINPGTDPFLPKLPPPPYPPPATTGRIDLAPLTLDAATVSDRIVGKIWDEQSLAAFCSIQRWDPAEVTRLVAGVLAGQAASSQLVAFRQRLACFGHNAPPYAQVRLQPVPDPRVIKGVLDEFNPGSLDDYRADEDSMTADIAYWLTAQPSPDLNDWDANPRSVWEDSKGNDRTAFDVFLERAVQKVVPGGWALFEGASSQEAYRVGDVGEQTLTDFSLTGRATGLDLVTGALGRDRSLKVRETTAYVQSEALPLAPLPVLDPIEDRSGGAPEGAFAIQLDRMVLGLSLGQAILLTGTTLDDQGTPGLVKSEVAQLAAAIHAGGYTTLYFASRLANRYVRSTLTLTANVAPATHGQTVARDILGSGDGSAGNQRFTLQKPPLTWVSAPTDTGRKSTLTVRVNDTAWEEVPSLYGLMPDARAYAIRTGNDGSSTVVFGDGNSGARLPTGQSNVVATYRSGIGLAGQVGAASLSVLMSRPLGVKGVTNPLPANGAADPETLDGARLNAPVTVLTLGRIVSLEDYQDFARAFAGVGKAQAVALWDGQSQVVHLTVAAADGTPLDPTSMLYQSLTQAILEASDGIERVRVDGFQPRKFRVEGTLTIDPTLEAAPVLAAATAALQDAFSFARRSFGQRVTSAEVVTVLQSVPGVLASNLTTLVALDASGADQGSGVQSILPAAGAHWENGAVALAEQLLLHPTGVKLSAGGRT